jgi:MFS transporter, DHA1 family, putative efflux transporter
MKTASRKTLLTLRPTNKLAVGWLTMFVIGSDLFVVSPLLPLIAADYGTSPKLAGFSVTIFSLTYMLSAPVLGQIADRVGRGRMLAYCLCAFSAANILTAVAGSLTWLLVARLCAGAAAAGVSPSIYALVGGSAPFDQRATWLSIVVSGLLMSLSIGASTGGLIGAAFGWRIVFGSLAALSLLLVWANSCVWRDCYPTANPTLVAGRLTISIVILRFAPTVVWSTAVYATYTYLGDGLASFGYSTGDIAIVLVFYGCGAISGVLLGGRMTDRLGSGLTSAIGLSGLCCCFFLLRLLLDAGVLVDCAFGLLSLVAQLFFPAQQVRLAQEFPAARATILAWNNSALFLGISLGSLIGGQAISLAGFNVNLVISAVIAAVGLAFNQGGYPTRAADPVMRQRQPAETQGAR